MPNVMHDEEVVRAAAATAKASSARQHYSSRARAGGKQIKWKYERVETMHRHGNEPNTSIDVLIYKSKWIWAEERLYPDDESIKLDLHLLINNSSIHSARPDADVDSDVDADYDDGDDNI